MADILAATKIDYIMRRFKDMGDGTHAEIVAVDPALTALLTSIDVSLNDIEAAAEDTSTVDVRQSGGDV